MPLDRLLILVSVFFLTSVISVVTGSTSLITVPVMIAVGIDAFCGGADLTSSLSAIAHLHATREKLGDEFTGDKPPIAQPSDRL